MQRAFKALKSFSGSALEKLNTLEKIVENMANKSMAERKESDALQQEMEELLQRQRDLRDQTEADRLRDFEALEAQYQELMELQSVLEDHSTRKQTLSTRLDEKQRPLP